MIQGRTPEIDHYWDLYTHACRTAHSERPSPRAATFEKVGFHGGCVSPTLVERFLAEFERCPPIPFRADDRAEGYVSMDMNAPTLTQMNALLHHRRISQAMAWIIADILATLKEPIAACMGSAWHALNMRIWSQHRPSDTTYITNPFGSYNWHSDGFPPPFCKLLVYFTPLLPAWGGLAVRVAGEEKTLVSEQRGTWLLLRNSHIIHRATMPEAADCTRISLEVTLGPAAGGRLACTVAGGNSHYPAYPWIRPAGIADIPRPDLREGDGDEE